MAYITLATITQFKPLDTGPPQDRAQTYATTVERYFARLIGFEPEAADATERVNGSGTGIQRLKRWPIKTVASLTIDGAEVDVLGPSDDDLGQLVAISDDGRWLEHRTGVFSEGVKNIKVTYNAGWTASELLDLALAGAMIVHLLISEVSTIGLGATTIGDQQIQTIVRNSKDYQFIQDVVTSYTWRPF